MRRKMGSPDLVHHRVLVLVSQASKRLTQSYSKREETRHAHDNTVLNLPLGQSSHAGFSRFPGVGNFYPDASAIAITRDLDAVTL